ncbi:MAG TPA: response regulator [Anaerolineales bacterium]|jgi:CheY-like chemotaxis protein
MAQPVSQGERILVVDDDPTFCSIMSELLCRQGYQVGVAFSVDEAKLAIEAQVPDLILTDIMMPEVDGLCLVRALRASPGLQAIPTVVVSARVMEEDRRAAHEAGADAFLGKPFSLQRLRTTIHSLLPAN